jgi:hypothetical protein
MTDRPATTIALTDVSLDTEDSGYDAAADFEQSLLEAYGAVRERMARGGAAWVPRPRSLAPVLGLDQPDG